MIKTEFQERIDLNGMHFVYRYQNELPKRIKQRGKNAHLVHEELVQAMKWKQTVCICTFVIQNATDVIKNPSI